MNGENRTFGEIFKTEREKRQETLAHVAYELKIRETTLDAFEQMRFDEFPPEGYAQGMVTSYARYLGLDPTEMLDQYRSELDAHENRAMMARDTGRNTKRGGGSKRTSRRNTSRVDDSGAPPITSGRAAVATGKERNELPWKLMLAIAIAIFVLGLGIWGVFSLISRDDNTVPPPITSEDTSTTPTDSGITSDEETAGVQGSSTGVDSRSLPFDVEIKVKDGQTSWIEVVDVDGDRGYAGSLVGPESKTYTVSESTEIIIGKPSVVTITRDGKPVKITKKNGTGKVVLSVDDDTGASE